LGVIDHFLEVNVTSPQV